MVQQLTSSSIREYARAPKCCNYYGLGGGLLGSKSWPNRIFRPPLGFPGHHEHFCTNHLRHMFTPMPSEPIFMQ